MRRKKGLNRKVPREKERRKIQVEAVNFGGSVRILEAEPNTSRIGDQHIMDFDKFSEMSKYGKSVGTPQNFIGAPEMEPGRK